SSIGQLVATSEHRLRILVACGAAGAIAATFNAPLTGLFFAVELILRAVSLEALVAAALSAVAADAVGRAFLGSRPFFATVPAGLPFHDGAAYVLVVVLGLAAGVAGASFKTVLYRMEDTTDRLWRGRPEWARPATGGIALGLLLIALPQMYGVG